MTAADGEVFKMTIEKVITITRRPGLFLAGKIEAGRIRPGDRLSLRGGEKVVREVTCDAAEFVDVEVTRPELALVAVR